LWRGENAPEFFHPQISGFRSMAFVSVPQILTPMRHLRQDEYERKLVGAENTLCQECTEKSAQAKSKRETRGEKKSTMGYILCTRSKYYLSTNSYYTRGADELFTSVHNFWS
jgi:hypothetical protein